MISFIRRAGLRTATALMTAALPALSAAAFLSTPAEAQDYTTGALSGSVTDDNGAPVGDATITLTSEAQGYSRVVAASSTGRFSVTGLAPGAYAVVVHAPGFDAQDIAIDVAATQDTRLDSVLKPTGSAVVVKGRRVRMDFTRATTGLAVDVDALADQVPVARNLNAVVLLAPTVVSGHPDFGAGDDAVASFGGGSVAENAYYIDGLNITNPDTYVSGARVPFDFYKSIEVMTGGYPAEFGRATGGVVNATTKSGSNRFTLALHGNFQPETLRGNERDTFAHDGRFSTATNNSLVVEMGGALIRDRLFAYGLYQANQIEWASADTQSQFYQRSTSNDPFYGLKFDGYITPSQRLSLTAFDTSSAAISRHYGFDGTDVGDYTSTEVTETGGRSWVLNYSGRMTDWLTLSTAVGEMRDRHNVVPEYPSAYYVRVVDMNNTSTTLSRRQPTANARVTNMKRKFWRADGDVRFDAFGRHHIRFGIDHEDNSETKTDNMVGGVPVQYIFRTYDDIGTVVNNDSLLQIVYQQLGGNVASQNQAVYIQDSWDITPDLNLQIGLREDAFRQYNLSGERYIDLTGDVAPRLGFSWDPTGEGAWKIHGSYGANFIPPAMNLGVRGKDLFFSQYFEAPTGGWMIDPQTGLPAAVGPAYAFFGQPCPASQLSAAPGFNASHGAGDDACFVIGNGEQEGATSKAAIGLKATRVDEVTLGADYRLNDLWSLGLNAIYRDTANVSEDSEFGPAIINYLTENGLDASQYLSGEISNSYYVWNVGNHGATIRLKAPLPGETEQRVITLTADQLGHFADAKREYMALSFDFKRAFDGKWGLQGSYTLSRLYGNYSGTVTEFGNTVQTDAGATYLWDSPGIDDHALGLLPGNPTHSFKVWGAYAFTANLLGGFNIHVQSPTRFSCLGLNPNDDYAYYLGSVSHYCGGNPAPMGKGLKSDWIRNVDASLRYTVPQTLLPTGKLVLRADVFNLFDVRSVVTRHVTYDGSDIGFVDENYGKPTHYTQPRSIRIGFDLTY